MLAKRKTFIRYSDAKITLLALNMYMYLSATLYEVAIAAQSNVRTFVGNYWSDTPTD